MAEPPDLTYRRLLAACVHVGQAESTISVLKLLLQRRDDDMVEMALKIIDHHEQMVATIDTEISEGDQ